MPKAQNIHEWRLTAWNDFPAALDKLQKLLEAGQFSPPLFRGLGDSQWSLETTLERSDDTKLPKTLLDYYRAIANSKAAIESLTNRTWGQMPTWPEFSKLLTDESSSWIDRTLSNSPCIYEYLIYLRHHGFPSPLLDWTMSPYIAAHFAFDTVGKEAGEVLIYVYASGRFRTYGTDSRLFFVGPYVQTHPRHFLQQSRYSLCVRHTISNSQVDYIFLPHHKALESSLDDDLIVKILIPVGERKRALVGLDLMNINPYSLYGSEESLIRAVARRELLFKEQEG